MLGEASTDIEGSSYRDLCARQRAIYVRSKLFLFFFSKSKIGVRTVRLCLSILRASNQTHFEGVVNPVNVLLTDGMSFIRYRMSKLRRVLHRIFHFYMF